MRPYASAILCPLVFAVLGLGCPSAARAEEAGHEGDEGRNQLTERRRHSSHHRVHLGVNGAGLWSLADGSGHLGASGVFEVVAVPGWLEVAVYFGALFQQDKAVIIPIDLLLVKPFHLTRRIHPFIGAGGTIVPVVEPHSTALHAGLATAAGTNIWILNDLALTLEFNYNFLRERIYSHEDGGTTGTVEAVASAEHAGGMVHELGATTGFLLAW